MKELGEWETGLLTRSYAGVELVLGMFFFFWAGSWFVVRLIDLGHKKVPWKEGQITWEESLSLEFQTHQPPFQSMVFLFQTKSFV